MTKTLSEYWASHSHRAMSHAPDLATKLALALTPVRSVIRVIDDHYPPMTVDWAAVQEDKSISATDFKNNRIIINPLPIIEGKLELPQALDVETGFAMHEAGHGKHSRDRFKHLIKTETKTVPSNTGSYGRTVEKEVPAFRPMRIAAYLWNLVEDVRQEGEVGKEWPGFRPYFSAVLGYMWTHIESATSADLEKGNPNPALTRALQTVYLACRYPARAFEVLDPSESEEVAWWQAWQDDYLSDRVDTPTTIQRGLDHLAQDDEDVKQEMAEMEAQERAEEAAGEKARAMLERLMREGIEGTIEVCITDSLDGEHGFIDAVVADRIDQLLREQLTETRPVILSRGVAPVPIHITKPEETAQSRRYYIGKPNAEAAAMRAALVFRASAPQFDLKLLKDGTIDDEELYRWGMGDYRVFSERVVEHKPAVLMGLLVDLSGSMNDGYKLKTAQRLAQLFVWALHDQEGVETRVWGHTADLSEAMSAIYRLWEPGDPLSRLGLISDLPHANNRDSFAVEWCVRQMYEREQEQKILVVLSDGLPSGSGYGGAPAMDHMRDVCRWAEKHGVNVLQVAIDQDLDMASQNRMFGAENVLGFTSNADLMRQMTRVMGRFA